MKDEERGERIRRYRALRSQREEASQVQTTSFIKNLELPGDIDNTIVGSLAALSSHVGRRSALSVNRANFFFRTGIATCT